MCLEIPNVDSGEDEPGNKESNTSTSQEHADVIDTYSEKAAYHAHNYSHTHSNINLPGGWDIC